MTQAQYHDALVVKIQRYSQDNLSEANSQEVRLIITSMIPLAKASLFSYPMPAGSHWVNLSAKQIVRALGDTSGYLLSLIGYGTLNRGGFTIMNNKDMGDEVTKHISIKDRLNLAKVANEINLGKVDADHGQNTLAYTI